LGDAFAVVAFCSNGRDDVGLFPVKDFSERYDQPARARLAGLRAGLSTRMGGAADARKAVQTLAHNAINVFGIGLDGAGTGYLGRIFGRRNFVVIDQIARLPDKLPLLYMRLTS